MATSPFLVSARLLKRLTRRTEARRPTWRSEEKAIVIEGGSERTKAVPIKNQQRKICKSGKSKNNPYIYVYYRADRPVTDRLLNCMICKLIMPCTNKSRPSLNARLNTPVIN